MAIRGALWFALFVAAVTVCAGRGLPPSEVGSIAMVTDLNAGRFAAVLGHSKDVLHFAAFAAKYVFAEGSVLLGWLFGKLKLFVKVP